MVDHLFLKLYKDVTQLSLSFTLIFGNQVVLHLLVFDIL